MKPARPPSIDTLIKKDDSWELQHRICDASVVMREVFDKDDFWSKKWPAMLRKACVLQKHQCLSLLLDIRRSGDDKLLPLPTYFPAWLAKGLADNFHTLNDMPAALQLGIFKRMSGGSFSLRPQDGHLIISRGGIQRLFYQHRNQTPDEMLIANHPELTKAWRSWLRRRANIEIALNTLEDGFNTQEKYINEVTSALTDIVDHMPEKSSQEFLEQFLDRVSTSGPANNTNNSMVKRMSALLATFRGKEWNCDHQVWESWGARLCQALLTHSERSEIADQWHDVLVKLTPEGQVPRGWTFNEEMCKRIFEYRAPMIMRMVKLHEDGQWVSDEDRHRATQWLSETMEAWDRLEASGLVSEQDKRWWREAQNQAMGQDWHQRAHKVIVEMRSENNFAKWLKTHWSKWNSRELLLAANINKNEHVHVPSKPIF